MASSNKRERDLARARYAAHQRRLAEQSAKRRRRQQIVGGVVALVVVLGGIAWFVVSNRSPSSDQATGGPTPSGCGTPTKPTEKSEAWSTPPADSLVAGKTYQINLATNCGQVVIQSDPDLVKAAPKTVNSQVFLTGKGFFDASDCFRLTTKGLFVLQCGSPKNNGTGGPGYKIPDENLPKNGTNDYPAGTVAMANSGPNTNGSQFFLVYKDTTLGPDYTIWGKVVSGLDVLNKVAEQGVQGGGTDGKPVQPLVITKATTVSN